MVNCPRGTVGHRAVPPGRQANLRHSRHLVQRDARCSALAPVARAVGALASASVALCSASSRQQHLCGKQGRCGRPGKACLGRGCGRRLGAGSGFVYARRSIRCVRGVGRAFLSLSLYQLAEAGRGKRP